MGKFIGELDCIGCGYCCGYRRSSHFGGCSYSKEEKIPEGIEVDENRTIPVDTDDTCIYLEKIDNGFTLCKIQDKKPIMCKLYYCMIERKITELHKIEKFLKEKCEERERETLQDTLKRALG